MSPTNHISENYIYFDSLSSADLIDGTFRFVHKPLSNSYTTGCPPVRGDNPRVLASGLTYVQVDKHGITILYHLH